MNALPSIDPIKQPRQHRRKSPTSPQKSGLGSQRSSGTKSSASASPRSGSRSKSNAAYAHRRQGLELVTKIVTYSTLSLFGVVTLVHSIGYNLTQHSKLQRLETELQEAKLRTAKVNSNFNRSFDPLAHQNVMQENTYKVAPDRLQIFLVTPDANPPLSQTTPSK
jgi:hypothetical protein